MLASFPDGVYSPRTIENRPGVVYDVDDTKTFFAEDHEQVTSEVVAIETALGANLANLGLNGWLPLATIPTLQASDDPVYTLRFASDMTALIGLGNRIKLTQHGIVKYFIVVKVGAYTGVYTDIDVYGGTDYDIENTGTYLVTLPNFSIVKAPFGFPLDPIKWTESLIDGGDRSQASPTNNVWYNLGSLLLSIPIGSWEVYYKVIFEMHCSSAVDHYCAISLSTSSSSATDNEFQFFLRNADTYSWTPCFTKKSIIQTVKTTRYLIARQASNNISNFDFRGDQGYTVIKAICAYL